MQYPTDCPDCGAMITVDVKDNTVTVVDQDCDCVLTEDEVAELGLQAQEWGY